MNEPRSARASLARQRSLPRSVRALRLTAGPAAWFVALVASCGGGSSRAGEAGTEPEVLEIVSCSLGCGQSGDELTCGLANVAVNEIISVEFNQRIDPASVTADSFQLAETPGGAVPPGAFSIDPQNPRRLVFRPQLSFDSAGNPQFGLRTGAAYRLTIPGTLQSPDQPATKFLRGLGGSPNRRRLSCVLSADQGVDDASPGAPRVVVLVDVAGEIDPQTQLPASIERRVQANAEALLVDVYRSTDIVMVFDDIMNPATLVNPVTRQSPFIQIAVDPDGNPADPSDQIPIVGEFS